MRQYIVDAFTDKVFGGNPAAVCITEEWLPDELMMKIAAENNLSETAFAVKGASSYKLRWFTPGKEVDLCGHATLATGFVILNYYDKDATIVNFDTMGGALTVTKKGDLYEMDFPGYELTPVPITDAMVNAMGARPIEAYMGRDLLCVFDDEEIIRNMNPDTEAVMGLAGMLLQVTAPGKEFDCVSRSFAPKVNIKEDPVCGSGHCHIISYWGPKLNKNNLVAWQASARGGILYCEYCGDRIKLSGKAALYSIADIFVK